MQHRGRRSRPATIPAVVERGVLIRKFAAKSARRRLRSLMKLPEGPDGHGRVQGVLLSLHRYRFRPSRLELSSPGSTRRSCSRGPLPVPPTSTLTRRKRPTSDPGRRALPPRRLGVGVQWWADAQPRLEAGNGLPPYRYEGYDEGPALPSRVRLADSPTSTRELPRVLRHLSVEGNLRPRAALLRPGVHTPTFAPLDRFPWHSRRVHVRARQRLLREQPAGDLRSAGVCRQEPAGLEGYGEHCWGITASDGPGRNSAR